MKKLTLLLVLLLVGILATTSLGCSTGPPDYYVVGSYSGKLWFTDNTTGNDVTIEADLQFLQVTVDDLPPPLPEPGSQENYQPVIGHIKITVPTEEKTIRIRARSKLHKGDPSSANIYWDYWGDTVDNTHTVWAADCKLNGKGKYFLGGMWAFTGALIDEEDIYIAIIDKATNEVKYLWCNGVSDSNPGDLFDYEFE